MRIEDIQAALARRPFQPFQMEYSNGGHDDVRHLEMVQVSRRVLSLAVYANGEDHLPDHFVWCDPMHVVRLKPINGAGAGNTA